MDIRFLLAAIAIMLIIIAREILKKYCNFDMDKIDVEKYSMTWYRFIRKYLCKIGFFDKILPPLFVINKNTGDKNLVLMDSGDNKATVMATLRQITDMDYKDAKYIVNHAPYTFMTNISDKEAELNKKALEFVGAKINIK